MWCRQWRREGGGQGGGQRGGAIGPGQLWRPGPSWILFCVDRKSVGDPGGGIQG